MAFSAMMFTNGLTAEPEKVQEPSLKKVRQNKFHVFIHNRNMHVQMEKAKEVVTNKTLENNGVDLTELKAAYMDIMTTIGLKSDSSIKVRYTENVEILNAAEFQISEVPVGSTTFEYFQVNVFEGQIYVTYFDKVAKISPETARKLDIDWERFAKAISRLQSAFKGEPVVAKLSKPIPEGTGANFELRYKLYKQVGK